MKRLLFITLSAITAFGLSSFADMCDNLYMFKEGSSTKMTHYNEKGKETGSNKTVYTSVNKSGDVVTVKATSETFDKKGKSEGTANYTMRCKDGILYFDMRMMLSPEQTSSTKDVQMTVEGGDLEFPADLKVGSTLKDGTLTMKSTTSGEGPQINLFNINMRIYNRKVEAKENVTTPAGTFECFKITSDFETKALFKISGKTATWFSQEAGTVKTESYDSKGKLQGYSTLTELIKK